MIRLLVLAAGLVALLSPGPVRAQATCSTLPYHFVNGVTADADQVNAQFAAVVACVNSGAAVAMGQVATNLKLKQTASTAFAAVTRLGFTVSGDAPPLGYVPSSAPCTLNAGAGDNGSQVPSADGKCWLASFVNGYDPRYFGAPGDNATESTAAVQAAINAVPTGGLLSCGGGGTHFLGVPVNSAFLTLPHAIDFGKNCHFRYANGTATTDFLRFTPTTNPSDYEGLHIHDGSDTGAGPLRHDIVFDMTGASNNLIHWQVDRWTNMPGGPVYAGTGAANTAQVGHAMWAVIPGAYTIRDGTVGPRNLFAGCVDLENTLDHITLIENTFWYRSFGDTECGWRLSSKVGDGAGKLTVVDNTSTANGGNFVNGYVSPVVTGNYIEQTNTPVPAALEQIAVSGTILGGDSGSITITPPGVTAIVLAIPVVGGDTTAVIAQKVTDAINNSSAAEAAGVLATVDKIINTNVNVYAPYLTSFARTSGSNIVFTLAADYTSYDLFVGGNAGPAAVATNNIFQSVVVNTTIQLTSVAGIAVGQAVTGASIPGATTVAAVGDTTHPWITLSAAQTGAIAAGATVVVGGVNFTVAAGIPTLNPHGVVNYSSNAYVDNNWFGNGLNDGLVVNYGTNLNFGAFNTFAGVQPNKRLDFGTGTTDLTGGIVGELNFHTSTAATTTTNNVASLIPVTGLVQTLLAGKTYNCKAHLFVTTPGAAGINPTISTPDTLTASLFNFEGRSYAGTTNSADTIATTLAGSMGGATAVITSVTIDGGITASATGTFQVYMRQNIADPGTTSVDAGSTFSCVPIN